MFIPAAQVVDVTATVRGLGGRARLDLALPERYAYVAFAESLGHLVAHEFHHTWTYPRIDFSGALRFYGEGFTDYYAYFVLAELGLLSWQTFTETVAARIGEYHAALAKSGLSLADAGGPAFFSDPSRGSDGDRLFHRRYAVAAALTNPADANVVTPRAAHRRPRALSR